MKAVSSIGFMGSWLLNCTAKSFMKSAEPKVLGAITDAVGWVLVKELMEEIGINNLGEGVEERK